MTYIEENFYEKFFPVKNTGKYMINNIESSGTRLKMSSYFARQLFSIRQTFTGFKFTHKKIENINLASLGKISKGLRHEQTTKVLYFHILSDIYHDVIEQQNFLLFILVRDLD